MQLAVLTAIFAEIVGNTYRQEHNMKCSFQHTPQIKVNVHQLLMNAQVSGAIIFEMLI